MLYYILYYILYILLYINYIIYYYITYTRMRVAQGLIGSSCLHARP